MFKMTAIQFYLDKLAYPDFEEIKDEHSPLTNSGVVHFMDIYSKHINEKILNSNVELHSQNMDLVSDILSLKSKADEMYRAMNTMIKISSYSEFKQNEFIKSFNEAKQALENYKK